MATGRSSSSSGAAGRHERMPAPLDGDIIPPPTRPRRPETTEQAANAAGSFQRRFITFAAASAGALVLGTSVVVGLYLTGSGAAPARPDPTAMALARLQQDVGTLKSGVDSLRPLADPSRQDETIRQLKKSVDALKAELDAQRSASTAALTQLTAKLDKPDRDPAPRLGEIAARLDRIEKQVSSPAATGTVVAPAKPAAVTVVPQSIATPVVNVEKSLPKPATLDTYVVRDVYDGLALVERRSGGVREVAPGEYLPGAGEVRSIERRGRTWVVVTSRGIIDTATW